MVKHENKNGKDSAEKLSGTTPDEDDLENSKVEMPEIGYVIVAIGLSTIAIASGYGSPYLLIKISSLIIYILAIWGGFIFYFYLLFEKIPNTMENWVRKKRGYFSFRGVWWVFTHWLHLVLSSGFIITRKRRAQTLECSYLTILFTLFLFWFTGILLYLIKFIELLDK